MIVQVAQFLLDRGVSAIAKDLYNCTPLFYAAYKKNFPLANFFAGMSVICAYFTVSDWKREVEG